MSSILILIPSFDNKHTIKCNVDALPNLKQKFECSMVHIQEENEKLTDPHWLSSFFFLKRSIIFVVEKGKNG